MKRWPGWWGRGRKKRKEEEEKWCCVPVWLPLPFPFPCGPLGRWHTAAKIDPSTHPTRKGNASAHRWPTQDAFERTEAKWMGAAAHPHRDRRPWSWEGDVGGPCPSRRMGSASKRIENTLDVSRSAHLWWRNSRIGTVGAPRVETTSAARRSEGQTMDGGSLPPPPAGPLYRYYFFSPRSRSRRASWHGGGYGWSRISGKARLPWPWQGAAAWCQYDMGRSPTPTFPDASTIDEMRLHL